MFDTLESRRLLSVSVATRRAVPITAAVTTIAATETFVGGNGKKQFHQYPGKDGGGWRAGWSRSSRSLYATVLTGLAKKQSAPIDTIEPHYLQVTTTATSTISRPYLGTAGTSDRVVQFNYRYDGTISGRDGDDSITVFGGNAGQSTWVIKALVNQTNPVWKFGTTDSDGNVLFAKDSTSGITVRKNEVYQFTLNLHLDHGKGSYTATVRDTTTGAAYTSPTSLEYLSTDAAADSLNFGIQLAGGERGMFSIDALHVASKPVVAPVVFVIGGSGDPQFPQPGNGSVQQHFTPLFNYAGINTRHFRWYEENYDSDRTVNPKSDTIAHEIDKIPAGTPVVLMGLSFGGGQAVSSAAQVHRPIDALILFDPVVQTDYTHQVNHTSADPAKDHPTQVTRKLLSNVKSALDLSRVIFNPAGALYDGPYPFTINQVAGRYENILFPRTAKHETGQITPKKGVSGRGPSGSPINDTAEFVENAINGFPLFWDQ